MTYCGLFLCLSFQIYAISNQRLPTAVLQRREDLYKKRCEVEGCGWCITIDGGLKPHRMLCACSAQGTLDQNQNTV